MGCDFETPPGFTSQIGQVGCVGHEIENDVVIQPLKGDKGLGQRGLGYVAP